MNHLVAPTHFVEAFDAHGNRTVETRTYPVQPRRPASPKAKKVTKKPEPKRPVKVVTVFGSNPVTNTLTATPLEVASATPVQPPPPVATPLPTTKVERASRSETAMEYAPIQRVVPTVPVLTGSLEKFRGDRSTTRTTGRTSTHGNYGRKPRAKDLRVNIAA